LTQTEEQKHQSATPTQLALESHVPQSIHKNSKENRRPSIHFQPRLASKIKKKKGKSVYPEQIPPFPNFVSQPDKEKKKRKSG
jgi:hypothetical protein